MRSPPISHSNCRHKRSADLAASQGNEHIAYPGVVNSLCALGSFTDRAMGKDDRVYAAHGGRKGVRVRQISDDDFDLARQLSRLVRIALANAVTVLDERRRHLGTGLR